MHKLPSNMEIFITQDGSPTLIWHRGDGYQEKMHHSGGALSESFYIYHHALRLVRERGWPLRIASIGLGLGYNEIIAVAELQPLMDWKVWSFEREDFLRDSFRQWLGGDFSQLNNTYAQIAHAVALRLSGEPSQLCESVRQALGDGRLELLGAFPPNDGIARKASCIFYDAYSNKMDPELWDEEALCTRLADLCGDHCVLATYAVTGTLKRALRRLGFSLMARNGFLHKRESTLAIREPSR